MNGTLTAAGVLAPTLTTKAQFKLGESVYDNLPLTGARHDPGRGHADSAEQARRSRWRATTSICNGSFGAPGDRLRFRVDAPQLERLGFGLAGSVKADGDVTGSFAHPNVAANYQADSVVFGANRLGHAEGHAELRDGANGALVFTTDKRAISAPNGVELATLDAQPDRHARAAIRSTPPRPARCAARRST